MDFIFDKKLRLKKVSRTGHFLLFVNIHFQKEKLGEFLLYNTIQTFFSHFSGIHTKLMFFSKKSPLIKKIER